MTEVERTDLSALIQSKKEKWRQVVSHLVEHTCAIILVLFLSCLLPPGQLGRRASASFTRSTVSRHKWMPSHLLTPSPTTTNPPLLRNLVSLMTIVFYSMLILSFYIFSARVLVSISHRIPLTCIHSGPFLNERNLPRRRIPSLDTTQPHDATAPPVTSDAPSVPLKKVQEGNVNSLPGSPAPKPSRPEDPIEKRDASPGTSSTTSGATAATEIPSKAAVSLGTNHDALPPKVDAAQPPNRASPGQLSQTGTKVAQNDDETERSQGMVGREVAFVEPEKRSTGLEHGNNAAQHAAEGPSKTEVNGHATDPDAMDVDVDETSGRPIEAPRLTSIRPPPLDASRPTDVLSSPGSTTQTATTPAVQEASPDTSPDNEGPQYPGDDEDLLHHTKGKDTSDIAGSSQGEDHLTKGPRGLGTSQSVSAQQLSESASAGLPAESNTLPPADRDSGSSVSAQTARPNHPLTDDTGSGTETGNGKNTSEAKPVSQALQTSHRLEATPKAEAAPSVDNDANLDTSMSVEIPDQQTPGPSTSMSTSFNEASTQSTVQRNVPTDVSPSAPRNEPDLLGNLNALQQQEAVVPNSRFRKRSLAQKHGLKHKRAPTVKFQKTAKKPEETIVASQSQGRYRVPTDDYFVPLFFDGFTRQSNWMKSPEQLLSVAHKTLSSTDCNIVLQESQACKVLRRIYHLQGSEKWSLRQPKRCAEPTRQPSHWDSLLQEMKWMRTDFREERKWKRAVAQNLAEACAEWVASNEEERKILQVNAKVPSLANGTSADRDTSPGPETESLPTPMPDLVPSNDADSPMDIDDEPQDWHLQTVAPSAIFALQDDEVVFGLQRSAASDQLLDELPLYSGPLKVPEPDMAAPEYDPDAQWRRDALPLSKYVEGALVIKQPRPRLQQSRFKYAVEEEEDEFEVLGAQDSDERTKLAPENDNVALFRPDMKMIRDRLHAGVKFRPPTESLMPLQSFYENRIASAWTPEQDDQLKQEVREHSYNWSLISQIISAKSLFVSAEDRRTPWECFERWVYLEGYPNESARTQYFQTYQRRIDSAQRAIAQANENARPQVGPNGVVTPDRRRRSTLPYRVDRRTSKRHLQIVEAMKKQAKKREAAAAKQQQTANNQNRKPSIDNLQQKLPTKTPDDYSRLRHERDKQLHERLARIAQQQQEAHRQQVSTTERRFHRR